MKKKVPKVLLTLFFFVLIANICSAQNTARGIAAEKIAVEQNDEIVQTEPKLYFPTGEKHILGNPIYSPKGNVVARIDEYNSSIFVWDVETGKEIKMIKVYTKCITIVFSPNGRYLASGGEDKIIRIWDLLTGNEVSTLVGHTDAVTSLVYSSDGKYLSSGGKDGTIRIWNLLTGNKIKKIYAYYRFVESILYSPDDKYLISIGDYEESIRVFDVLSGKEIIKLEGYTSCVSKIVFSPNGKYLAASDYNTIRIWDILSGNEIYKLEGDSKRVRKIVFSPNGKYLVSVCEDKDEDEIFLWDTLTWNKIQSVKGDDVSFAPNNKYIAIKSNTLVEIWNMEIVKKEKEIEMGTYQNSFSLFFSYDSKYILITTIFQMWRYDIEKELIEACDYVNYKFDIRECIYSPNGEYALTKGIGLLELFDLKNGGVLKRIEKDDDESFSDTFFFSPDSKYIVILCRYGTPSEEWYKKIRIYDILNEKFIANFDPYKENLKSVVCSLDGKYLANLYEDGTVLIWDLLTRSQIEKFKMEKNINIKSFVFDSKRKYFVSIDKNDGFIWDFMNGRELLKFQGTEAVFSPNGKYISIIYNNVIKILDILTGKEIKEFKGKKITYSPNSRYIIIDNTFYDKTIKVYDILTGEEIKKFENTEVAYSPNNRYIMIDNTRFNGDVKIWDTVNGNEVFSFKNEFICNLKSFIYLKDKKYIVCNYLGNCIMQVLNIETKSPIYTIVIDYGSDYLTYTPEGFFTGTEWAMKNLVHIVDGMDVIGIDQVYDKLYRPDLVAAKMRGEDISEYAKEVNLASIVRSGNAPSVAIKNLPELSDSRDVTFDVCVQNTGGGIGNVSIVLNGKTIQLSEGVASSRGEQKIFRHTVTLKNGQNKIEAFAMNSAGMIESRRASADVSWQGKTSKPNLYVLTVAVNKYRDKDLWLNYCVSDAASIEESFKKQKNGLYENICVYSLKDAEVTKEGLEQKFTELSSIVTADDVFVFFVSGHGTAYDDGDYYFIPVNFRYTNKTDIPLKAISKSDLTKNLSLIKAGKTLMMLDTCNSGAFFADSNKRGMGDKGIFERLSRATGHAILAAASDSQSAMEGYNGHGVFTYVLLDGLAGKADSDGDGFVTLTELSNYVENQVPELSYEKWGYEQVPQKELRRQDFPIAETVLK